MIDTHQKNDFFKILYKICKERNIDFYNFQWSKWLESPDKKYICILKLFLGFEKYINEFIKFYRIQEELNKDLIILHKYMNLGLEIESNINIKQKNIYGGFMYLNKKKYQLFDKSFLKAMDTLKKEYKESKKNEQ